MGTFNGKDYEHETLEHIHGIGCILALALIGSAAQAADKKPNIPVIFGDDIGLWNISAYNRGMMGYRAPNIDRITKEGAIFTDCYAQSSTPTTVVYSLSLARVRAEPEL